MQVISWVKIFYNSIKTATVHNHFLAYLSSFLPTFLGIEVVFSTMTILQRLFPKKTFFFSFLFLCVCLGFLEKLFYQKNLF